MKRAFLFILNFSILCFSLLFLIWIDGSAKNRRRVPSAEQKAPPVYRVNTQRDVYDIYKTSGLWGVRVVHLNRFLNMVDYFPREEHYSSPFPIQIYDIRPAYERGLDSHNWLFIATRTGMVRKIDIIFPERIFKERLKDFAADFAFKISGQMVHGYSYDNPLAVTTMYSLPVINEPVVMDVDAGFFAEGMSSSEIFRVLKEKYPDIRLVVLVDSYDETDITDDMREAMRLFESEIKQEAGRV